MSFTERDVTLTIQSERGNIRLRIERYNADEVRLGVDERDSRWIHWIIPEIDPTKTYWQNFRAFWSEATTDFWINIKYAWPILAFIGGYLFAASWLLQLAEAGKHWTYRQSVYLTWITMTTVGYGDMTPDTRWGRVIVSADAFVGIVLIGVVVWIVTTSLSRK
jgi:Ion channel